MQHESSQTGFTLIEVLITLLVGMVILGGMTSVFIAQTRTSTMLSDKTAAMGDLYLSSQIMQTALRGSKAICWNAASNMLVYQPFDSPTNLTAGCAAPAASNGAFKFKSVLTAAHPTPYICWDRPNDGSGCQELLRNLVPASGLGVTPVGNASPDMRVMRTVVISAQYQGQDHSGKPLELAFKVWPRN